MLQINTSSTEEICKNNIKKTLSGTYDCDVTKVLWYDCYIWHHLNLKRGSISYSCSIKFLPFPKRSNSRMKTKLECNFCRQMKINFKTILSIKISVFFFFHFLKHHKELTLSLSKFFNCNIPFAFGRICNNGSKKYSQVSMQSKQFL